MRSMQINISKWNLKPLLEGDSDPRIEELLNTLQDKNSTFINKWENREDYLKDPLVLKESLIEYEELQKSYGSVGIVYYYFILRNSQDQEDPKIKSALNKAREVSVSIGNKIQFFEMRLSKINPELQKEFLNSSDLSEYKHFLEESFNNSKYLLSEPEEKILNLFSKTAFGDWVDMVEELLSKETSDIKGEERNFSEILSLLSNEDKDIRDEAAKRVNELFIKHIDVGEHEINAVLQYKKVNDEVRGYTRPDQSRHLHDDIDSSVVDALIEAVSESFDISQRYYELKAKVLGVNKLAYHERNLEISSEHTTYSIEDSLDIVHKVFKSLDPEFSDILESYLDNGQIDVFPSKGKVGGAFCIDILKSLPVYVLLNHTNQLRDVTTLAHEMGHALNNEYMKRSQNALNYGNSTAVAEVASTFMEDFVFEELKKSADEKTRFSLLMSKLNDDVSSIQRQVSCYLFEQDLHTEYRSKLHLTKEEIGKLFSNRMSEYMGDSVEQSPGSENWWLYWSHVRRFFYVYSYASGLLISKSLQALVKQDPKNIEKVKEILSVGSSLSPLDTFKKVGIDLADPSFWKLGLTEEKKDLEEAWKLAKSLGFID